MNPVQFTCNMCGEIHNKVLPLSTDRTSCHRCGNLIDISALQSRSRRTRYNHERIGNNYLDDLEEYAYGLDGGDDYPIIDDDFYNFDRYESHDDYLPNPNRRNPRFNNNSNNGRRRGDNRPFVRGGNNRSSSQGGMFSIQIANDNYDRMSAFNRRSNFGYPGNNNRNRNMMFAGLMDDFDFEDELNDELEFMSILDSNNNQPSVGLLASILNPPPKPKLKLKKIKMCKDLYTINDNGKSERPTCCICLGIMKINDDVVLLKCQHLFHFKCLDKWVETKEACPFCRGKIEFGKIIKKPKKKVEEKKEDAKVEDKKEDKKVEDKKEDEKIEDKKVEDKKVEDKKIEDKKMEDKKIENKKLEDKKVNHVKPIIQKKKSSNNIQLFKNKKSKK